MKLKLLMTVCLSLAICVASFGQMEKNSKLIGNRFPTIESASLAGQQVHLPEDIEGEITLVTVAFFEEGQQFIDSWAEPYLKEYFGKDGFNYYEVPMLNNMPQATRNFIDSGMRAGIKQEMHPNVVTFYGDYSVYLELLNMKNIRSGYAFLLDRKGTIRFQGEGMMTDQQWKAMKQLIEEIE